MRTDNIILATTGGFLFLSLFGYGIYTYNKDPYKEYYVDENEGYDPNYKKTGGMKGGKKHSKTKKTRKPKK